MMPTDDVEQPSSHAKRALVDHNDNHIGRSLHKRQRTSNENVENSWWRKPEQIKLSHTDYTVGWICALPIELAASHAMLDDVHESLPITDNDTNAYILGRIGEHNVAMACLPFGHYGTINAATVANNMTRSFKAIRFGFMVGIGGGVPGKVDIRLGDVVVGTSVIQHDMGKIIAGNRFQGTATTRITAPALLNVISKLQALCEGKESQVTTFLREMQERYPKLAEYAFPTACEDRLFRVTNQHSHDRTGNCSSCTFFELCDRPPRDDTHPWIHYGGIASGNQVIKCSQRRDELAEEHDILCFEMEAAGLSDVLPCVVVRGICDYADSQKNKEWQKYAAATAAACAKELVLAIAPSREALAAHSSQLPLAYEPLEGRREHLLELIRFEQIYARHSTIETAHTKTCKWLIEDPLYEQWQDQSSVAQHGGFFWISGKPGAGKSTIMKFVYGHQRKRSHTDDAVISFFFNARGDDLEKSTCGMYRSLLLQLLEKFVDLQSVLDNTLHIPTGQNSCPNEDTVRNLFHDAVMALGQRRLICFIDALDECDAIQIMHMVVYFENLGESAAENGVRLRICFSSRHYPYIDIRYGLKLVLEDQPGHGRDLESYVTSHLRMGKGKHLDDIRAEVLDRAKGVFLWVVLVCRILTAEYPHTNKKMDLVQKRLREIPDGLSNLFKDILRRDTANMERLLLCIQWILFAKRPLALKEFYFAMLSGTPELQEDPTPYKPEADSEKDMRLLVTASSKGLAEITKSKKGTVQFIHESVKDFLVNDGGFRELWPELDDNFEVSGHEKLKQCCHSHITADVSRQIQLPNLDGLPKANSEDAKRLRQDALEKFPFLEYATENLFHHANFVAQRVSQEVFFRELLLDEWIRLSNMLERYGKRRYTQHVSLAYILAEKNFCALLKGHMCQNGDVYVQGERYGYPFFAALANGHVNATKVLLGQGAESVPTEDLFSNLEIPLSRTKKAQLDGAKYHPHPLNWAIREKLWTIAGAIVDSGDFDYSTLNKGGQNLIHLASIAGNESFMQKVLEKLGSEQLLSAQSTGMICGTPIIQDGPGRSSQIDLSDHSGHTPLWYAYRRRDVAITRQLLKWGAQSSKIHSGIEHSAGISPAMMELFMEHGCLDLESLLGPAVDDGLEKVVDRILGHSKFSDISTIGPNLLEKAAAGNQDAILRLLLDRGVATVWRNWNSYDVAIRAIYRNDESAFQYFIEKGADVVALVKRAYSLEDEHLIKLLIEAAPEASRILQVALM